MESLILSIGSCHGNNVDKFEKFGIKVCEPGWKKIEKNEESTEKKEEKGNGEGRPGKKEEIDENGEGRKGETEKEGRKEKKEEVRESYNGVKEVRAEKDGERESLREVESHKEAKEVRKEKDTEIKEVGKQGRKQEIPFALMDCVAHLICQIKKIEENWEKDHLILNCKIINAFVKKDYWNGKQLFPQGKDVPPFLSFLGSQEFGKIC